MDQIRGSSRNKEKGNKKKGGKMTRKVLEYTKKMALVRKLFRQGLISDQEYNKITRKLEDAYMIIGDSSFFGKTGDSEKTMATV